MDLLEAYKNTDYVVLDEVHPQYNGTIHLGKLNAHIDEQLGTYDTWAFITAWNPASTALPIEENHRRNLEMSSHLVRYNLSGYSGFGSSRDEDIDWTEEHLFIPGMSIDLASNFAKHYGQNAVLVGEKHKKSKLIIINPELINFYQSAQSTK